MNDTIEARWEQQNEAGRLSFTDGDFAHAEQSFLAAIREATQLGADNVRLASSLSNLGQLKYKQKDFAQAEALFHRALAIRERVLGPEHFGLVQNINNLAALHYARGELEQAEPLFQRALGISEQHLGESHPDVAVTLNNLARLYFRRGDYIAAAPLLTRLLTIKEQSLGASHPEIAAILTSLAKVRLAAGDYDGGEQYARRALVIREKLQLPNDLAVATALDTLAEIFGARGHVDDEMWHRERALEVRVKAMGAEHPTVVAARAALEARRASAAPVEESPVMETPSVAAPSAVAPPPQVASPSHIAPPPAAPKPPVAAPTPPARTTRTSSLPWLDVPEPPTFDRMRPSAAPMYNDSNGSVAVPVRNGNGNGNGNGIAARTAESPLAFHPLVEAPPAPSAAASAPPPAIERDEDVDALTDSPFTNSFARLVAETPSARQAIEEDAPPPMSNDTTEPRREISLDWPIEPRRPWMGIVMGVAALALIAGGGWYFLSRNKPTADASSGARSSVAAASKIPATVPAAVKRDSVTTRRDSIAPAPPATNAEHAGKSAPAAQVAANPKSASPASEAPNGTQGDSKGAAHAGKAAPAADTPRADAEAIGTPKLPSIKVDAITNMIDDSARQRADSVGRSIQQKPPTFKPKEYRPPGS